MDGAASTHGRKRGRAHVVEDEEEEEVGDVGAGGEEIRLLASAAAAVEDAPHAEPAVHTVEGEGGGAHEIEEGVDDAAGGAGGARKRQRRTVEPSAAAAAAAAAASPYDDGIPVSRVGGGAQALGAVGPSRVGATAPGSPPAAAEAENATAAAAAFLRDVRSPSAYNGKVEEHLRALAGPPSSLEGSLPPAVLQLMYDHLLAWWTTEWEVTGAAQHDFVGLAAARFSGFELPSGGTVLSKYRNGDLTGDDIDIAWRLAVYQRLRLEIGMRKRNMVLSSAGLVAYHAIGHGGSGKRGKPNDVGLNLLAGLTSITAASHTFAEVLRSWKRVRTTFNPSEEGIGTPNPKDPRAYVGYGVGQPDDFEELLLFLLNEMADRGYRRHNKAVYQQTCVTTKRVNGMAAVVGTRAWEWVESVECVVRSMLPKDRNHQLWKTSIKVGYFARAVAYLENCTDPEFTELRFDRHWHAFKNGLLYTSMLQFYTYDDPSIPSEVVACQYHNVNFNTSIVGVPWASIPTPHFDSVLNTQIKHREDAAAVLVWLYVFIGRLLFEVGEKDSWQVLPFFVGRAGTGKSLVLKMVGRFFKEVDVETISNHAQKDFGLETVAEKLLWRCMEVKGDFGLPQTDLQSMISGEPVAIIRKHKTQVNLTWRVPGIMAGNEVANWVDNSGSMSRRIILILFEQIVPIDQIDPKLEERLRGELANIMYKSVLAYLTAVRSYGNKDIWGFQSLDRKAGVPRVHILPAFFHEAKMMLKELTHPMVSFLRNCPDIALTINSDTSGSGKDDGVGMPFKRFKALFNAYAAGQSGSAFRKDTWKWTSDKFLAAFQDNGIKIVPLTPAIMRAMWPAGEGKHIEYKGDRYSEKDQWLRGVYESSTQLKEEESQNRQCTGETLNEAEATAATIAANNRAASEAEEEDAVMA